MAEQRFWLATFEVDGALLRALLSLLGPGLPIDADAEPGGLAIELRRFGDEATPGYAALLSVVDSLDQPTRLRCCLGYSNHVPTVDRLSDAGFPVVEATFDVRRGGDGIATLTIETPHYPKAADRLGLTTGATLVVRGVDFDASAGEPVDLRYAQLLLRPDIVRPGYEVRLLPAPPVASPRRAARRGADAAQVEFTPVLYPDFASCWPLAVPPGAARARCALAGVVDERDAGTAAVTPPQAGATGAARGARVPLSQASIFGDPTFRFDDVELLGFRIDLPPDHRGTHATQRLQALLKPLNFHRRPGGPRGVDDFEYRCASRSLVVELLRYGRMKSRDTRAPLTPAHYMAQHELVVRLLVGRVDDDTAQARDPAVFVPALFVDNPLSKAVGRAFQGYPKLLADFCPNSDGPCAGIGYDGMLRLPAIGSVRLAADIGAAPADAALLLGLELPAVDDDFEALDLSLFDASAARARLPWRQYDFEAPEFRRSFARSIVGRRFDSFRSVQVAPLGPAPGADTVWIHGSFTMREVEFQQPSGIASLTFGTPRGLPPGHPWAQLHDLLVDCCGDACVNLPSGEWYRVRCAMDLDIDDGLQW